MQDKQTGFKNLAAVKGIPVEKIISNIDTQMTDSVLLLNDNHPIVHTKRFTSLNLKENSFRIT